MASLRRISREMRLARPVFIVGEARSGTSILYRTLLKLSAFRTKEANLVETEIFSHLRRVFMFGQSYPRSLKRFMLDDDEAYGEFLASIRRLRVVSALNIPLNLVVRRPTPLTMATNRSSLVLHSYFFHARRARGCRRLVEKTPTNTPHIPQLTKVFPKARLLYIHRHPVDVFSSYRRRGRDDPNAAWARSLTVESFCTLYERSTTSALDWVAGGHTNLLLIPYERFAGTPADELRRICEFLDEPFEPEAVEERDPDPGRWRGDPLLWGPIVPVTKRWGDFTSEQEAWWIQSRLRSTMWRLGYRPYEFG